MTIIDDYAHHPTEIKATIDAARQEYPNNRLRLCSNHIRSVGRLR